MGFGLERITAVHELIESRQARGVPVAMPA